MEVPETVLRTRLTINGEDFYLSHQQDIDDLTSRIEAAVDSRGRFVDFTLTGDRQAKALITPATQVTLVTDAVMSEARDADDFDHRFPGEYDDYGLG